MAFECHSPPEGIVVPSHHLKCGCRAKAQSRLLFETLTDGGDGAFIASLLGDIV
uniref:Uncharacterized protein n=1 Tax=Oryza meridionalis TaxID=40149 RepID=A0A0E0EB20_9ORYZ